MNVATTGVRVPENPRLAACTGVILAGGRSRRMGGGPKAFAPLHGQPMVQHVIGRLRPQVEQLLLSVELPSPEFDVLGLEQVPDPEPGSNGPLGGLAAALRRATVLESRWLLVTPCDAPFLPRDLATRLHSHAVAENCPIAVARDGSGLQPAFSLWRTDQRPAVLKAVRDDGMAGFRQYLRGRSYAAVEWPAQETDPFFNINDRAALDRARGMAATREGCDT